MALLATKPLALPTHMMSYFLARFADKLEARPFAGHLPIEGNLPAMQAAAIIRGNDKTLAELEDGADKLAALVNRVAKSEGATHVSFEELDCVSGAAGSITTNDKSNGVSVRMAWAMDAETDELICRFDVCYRLWILLPPSKVVT